MWTRIELKTKAKQYLKDNYWMAFLILLITTIVATMTVDTRTPPQPLLQAASLVIDLPMRSEITVDDTSGFKWFFAILPTRLMSTFGLTGIMATFSILVSIAFVVFVTGPLSIGQYRFFLLGAREEETAIKDLAFAFNRDHFFNIILVQLYTTIEIYLFMLLLIVPGIMKAYSYAMVPYLLAEDPQISPKRATEISANMTDGHKWDMFVLDLSFILWHLLQYFTFGLSRHFVAPYVTATQAQLYLTLSAKNPYYNSATIPWEFSPHI